MRTQHYDTCSVARPTSHLFLRLAIGATTLALGLANSASAALIVDRLDYTGHVTNGTTFGTEPHSTTTNFPLPFTNNPLPKTADPPANLVPAIDLRVNYTTASEQFPVPGGPLYSTAILTISSATGRVFANNLDSSVVHPVYPVEVDAYVFSDVPGKKIAIVGGNIGVENFDIPSGGGIPPFLPPAYSVISGTGTSADPLHVHLGLNANQVSNDNADYGQVKLHLRFSEMIVPEPSACVLLLLGLAGLVHANPRRSRG